MGEWMHRSPFSRPWQYEEGLISLWLYKENNKLQDWKNVFTLHIPPSSTHLWLRCSNFFNPSKKNSFGCAANRKKEKPKTYQHPYIVGGEWSASCPGHFTPEERAPGTHWIGSWVGPRAGLDDVEKRKFLTIPGLELWPPVIQPIASCYTSCAIPAPI
jgi:hypothetical protein